MIIQWNSGEQQLAQGYGLSVWNWVVSGGASVVTDGFVCGVIGITGTVVGRVNIAGTVSGTASIAGTVGGRAKLRECE